MKANHGYKVYASIRHVPEACAKANLILVTDSGGTSNGVASMIPAIACTSSRPTHTSPLSSESSAC